MRQADYSRIMADVQRLVAASLQAVTRDPGMLEGRLRWLGVHRGFVEDVVDPEKRGRVRVRVPAAHSERPTALLPWAERCLPDAGADAGDFIPLTAGVLGASGHTGDAVWVQFEGGDIDKPVVCGLWHAAPAGVGQSPGPSKAVKGHRRRRTWRSRHGTTIEIGDERNDAEIKITMPGGHVVHLRESDGGRGVHVNTAGGHKLSLQDEEPGESVPTPANAYDRSPDLSHVVRAVPPGTSPPRLASGHAVPIRPDPPRTPNGVVASPTDRTAEGFGRKGVAIETSSGHRLFMSDVQERGIVATTAQGHYLSMRDDTERIDVANPQGDRVSIIDAPRRIEIVAGTQVVVSGGQDVTVNGGQTVTVNAGAIIGLNAPVIGVNAENASISAENGILTIRAFQINFEQL